MGINKQTLEMLLNENEYKKISGNFLCVGKQTVHVDLNHAIELFGRYGLSIDSLNNLYSLKKFDTSTRHGNETIFDHDLLACFSVAKYHCLDRSKYEGATIVHDMNTPIPENMYGQFDFIYNGSCMDNLFNPVSFIQNTSRMLKTGGRILHIECAAGVVGAYLMYSPQWFFSYYAINNFKDCKVYVTIAREEGRNRFIFDTDLFSWKPFFTLQDDYNYIKGIQSINGLMHVIVIAEKGKKSTNDLYPIQMQYLDKKTMDWRHKYYDFKKSERPLIKLKHRDNDSVLPYLSDHFEYLGSKF